jgi:hypothetical protein
MVRVFDFLGSADIGKHYKYRLRVAMRDPNYPENQDYPGRRDSRMMPAPENRELHHEVYARIAKLRAKEDKLIEDSKKKDVFKLRSLRMTEWSQPSSAVFNARPFEVFLGDVDAAKGTAKLVQSTLVGFSTTAKNRSGAFIGNEVSDAMRGTMLGGYNLAVDVITPITKMLKKADPPQTIAPGAVVVDMRGGVNLAGSSKDDPLASASEIMVLRNDGSIVISNSLDDQMLYRMYSFQEEIDASKKAAAGGGYGPGGGMGGPGGGMGGPGGGMGGEG